MRVTSVLHPWLAWLPHRNPSKETGNSDSGPVAGFSPPQPGLASFPAGRSTGTYANRRATSYADGAGPLRGRRRGRAMAYRWGGPGHCHRHGPRGDLGRVARIAGRHGDRRVPPGRPPGGRLPPGGPGRRQPRGAAGQPLSADRSLLRRLHDLGDRIVPRRLPGEDRRRHRLQRQIDDRRHDGRHLPGRWPQDLAGREHRRQPAGTSRRNRAGRCGRSGAEQLPVVALKPAGAAG